jgi:hypothetical protein
VGMPHRKKIDVNLSKNFSKHEEAQPCENKAANR